MKAETPLTKLEGETPPRTKMEGITAPRTKREGETSPDPVQSSEQHFVKQTPVRMEGVVRQAGLPA